MKVHSGLVVVTATLVLTLALMDSNVRRASAANILNNPDFASDISGWTTSFGATITHDAGTGNPAGSASVAITTAGNSAQSIAQCVPATAGETYTISADVLLPTANQPAGTVAFMTRNFNFSVDCTGGAVPSGGGQSSDTTPSDSWQTMSFGSLVAPPSTQGLLLVLFIFGSDPAGAEQSRAFFDNALVDLQGGATVTPSATTTPSQTPVGPTSTPSPTTTATSTSATATRTPTPVASVSVTPSSGSTTPVPAATSTSPGGSSGAGTIAPPDTGSGYGNHVDQRGSTGALVIALALAASGVLALREGVGRRS